METRRKGLDEPHTTTRAFSIHTIEKGEGRSLLYGLEILQLLVIGVILKVLSTALPAMRLPLLVLPTN